MPTPGRAARPASRLERARDDALATVRLVAGFDFPDFEQPYEYLALRAEHGYPIESGSVVTSSGGDASPCASSPSTSRRCTSRTPTRCTRGSTGRPSPTSSGPLARYSLNSDRLSPVAREAAAAAGLGPTCRNPFRSIVVRAVELVEACDEALRIIDGWTDGGRAERGRAAPGRGGARRHRGPARRALPPLRARRRRHHPRRADRAADVAEPAQHRGRPACRSSRRWLELDDHALQHRCEQAIRNYDPCISCATHFLDLTVERT